MPHAMPDIATDAVFAEYAPALRAFLAARCRDAELAGELTQEVAFRLVAAAPRLRANGNLRAYLFQVAANVWRDHVRRELVRHAAHERLAGEERRGPAADELVLERDLRAALRRTLATLPPAQQDVVRLRHVEGLRFREIAARLGRPLGTVLTQMRAALERMAAALEEYR
jgi:RNA polymerase sigma-70 factor (ECF subfamily)